MYILLENMYTFHIIYSPSDSRECSKFSLFLIQMQCTDYLLTRDILSKLVGCKVIECTFSTGYLEKFPAFSSVDDVLKQVVSGGDCIYLNFSGQIYKISNGLWTTCATPERDAYIILDDSEKIHQLFYRMDKNSSVEFVNNSCVEKCPIENPHTYEVVEHEIVSTNSHTCISTFLKNLYKGVGPQIISDVLLYSRTNPSEKIDTLRRRDIKSIHNKLILVCKRMYKSGDLYVSPCYRCDKYVDVAENMVYRVEKTVVSTLTLYAVDWTTGKTTLLEEKKKVISVN